MSKPKGFRIRFLHIFMINLYNILFFSRCNLCIKKKENWNNWNFSKSTLHKSVENCWITPKNPTSARNSYENLYINFTIATSAKKMTEKCWLTDQPTNRQHAFVSSTRHTYQINNAYSYLHIKKTTLCSKYLNKL